MVFVRDAVAEHVRRLRRRRRPWWCPAGCSTSTSTISSATLSNSSWPKPRVVSAGVPRRMPEVYQAPFGSRRDRVAVGDHAGVEQRRLGLPAGQAERRDVDQHQVVVGAAGHQPGAALEEPVGQRLGVVGDPLRVGAERSPAAPRRAPRPWPPSCAQSGPPRTMGQPRSTSGANSSVASTMPAARAAQRLVGRRGDHLGVRDGVLVAREDLAGHQPGEVGHVDHQGGADLVGDLAHLREVHPPRVRRVAGDEDQRPELAGLRGDRRRSRAARSPGRCRTAAGGTSSR